MRWSLAVVTPPTTPPITLEEAKAQARVDDSSEDSLIQTYIDAATAHLDGAQGILGRALVQQTWRWKFDKFPTTYDYLNPYYSIRVPLPPLSKVNSIKYYDSDNAEQTLDPSRYSVNIDAQPGVITPAIGERWPNVAFRPDAIEVEFEAGYGTATDVPAALRTAMLQLVAHWYDSRTPVVIGSISSDIPQTFTELFVPFQIMMPWDG